MTKVPEGYTELELVGFTDKGNYTEGTNYVKNDLVHYKGSIYKCAEDDTLDVPPNDTSCWEVFIPNQSNFESITAIDTEGKLGAKGEEVSAQQLVDKISRDTNKMVGATSETDGSIGLVPPPRAGDEDKALLGNGTWGKVDSIYKYKTEEEYNQAVANNEIPDGATVIKEWDEELSVIPVDSELSEESLNPLQNKVITRKIAELNQSIAELNGLLGGKLDVSKIANNLVTTEEGYALDARMGKELDSKIKEKYNVLRKLLSPQESITININLNRGPYILVIYANNFTSYGMYLLAVHYDSSTKAIPILERSDRVEFINKGNGDIEIKNIWEYGLFVSVLSTV